MQIALNQLQCEHNWYKLVKCSVGAKPLLSSTSSWHHWGKLMSSISIINLCFSLNQAHDGIVQIHLLEEMLILLINFYFNFSHRAFFKQSLSQAWGKRPKDYSALLWFLLSPSLGREVLWGLWESLGAESGGQWFLQKLSLPPAISCLLTGSAHQEAQAVQDWLWTHPKTISCYQDRFKFKFGIANSTH